MYMMSGWAFVPSDKNPPTLIKKTFHNMIVNSWDEAFKILKEVDIKYYLISLDELKQEEK